MQPGLVEIPVLVDPLGSIGVVEGSLLLPFEVRRFYFIRDVPSGATRGSHAHRLLHQLLIAVSGSVTVELDDGNEKREYVLDAPTSGLHVPPGYWRTLYEFAPSTVVAVLASREYEESDYIRVYEEFLAWGQV
jgi:dTDP-4-dehydrorhamnose 3,5-epimerase-like enzyme